jgi:hypothetical protein
VPSLQCGSKDQETAPPSNDADTQHATSKIKAQVCGEQKMEYKEGEMARMKLKRKIRARL